MKRYYKIDKDSLLLSPFTDINVIICCCVWTGAAIKYPSSANIFIASVIMTAAIVMKVVQRLILSDIPTEEK